MFLKDYNLLILILTALGICLIMDVGWFEQLYVSQVLVLLNSL